MASRWRRRRMCVLIAGDAAPAALREISATAAFLETNARPALGSRVELHHPEAGAIEGAVSSRLPRRRPHRLPLQRAIGRLRPGRDRGGHEPARLIGLPFASGVALGVEQSRQIVMLDPRGGGGGRGRLGAIGDAEARGLDHRDVVGAVADRQRIGRVDPALGRRVEQGGTLGPRPDDRLADRARAGGRPSLWSRLAITRSKPIAARHRLGEAGEAAGDEHGQGALRLHRAHQRTGARA